MKFVSVAATAPFSLFRGGGVADIISHVFSDLGSASNKCFAGFGNSPIHTSVVLVAENTI